MEILTETTFEVLAMGVLIALVAGVIFFLRWGFNQIFQVEITCRKCGHVSKDESLDCVRCGEKLA